MKKCDVYRVPCSYNSNKVYVIKHYKCGHYYLNEEISNFLFNRRFVKTSKHWIKELLKFN